MVQKTQKINSIEKALKIILAFSQENVEMTMTEIRHKVDLDKATTLRVLKYLVDYEFLQKDPIEKTYKFGKVAVDIGTAIRRSFDEEIVAISKPHIKELLKEPKVKSASLEKLSGLNSIMAYVVRSKGGISIIRHIGDMSPAYASAGGKAVLAFKPTNHLEKLLKQEMQRLTPKTIIDPKKLKMHLEEIRKQGFSFDNEEVCKGIVAIGVPILSQEMTSIAALSVAMLSYELTSSLKEKIIHKMKQEAKIISSKLIEGTGDF